MGSFFCVVSTLKLLCINYYSQYSICLSLNSLKANITCAKDFSNNFCYKSCKQMPISFIHVTISQSNSILRCGFAIKDFSNIKAPQFLSMRCPERFFLNFRFSFLYLNLTCWLQKAPSLPLGLNRFAIGMQNSNMKATVLLHGFPSSFFFFVLVISVLLPGCQAVGKYQFCQFINTRTL